jgi:predicted nucleic acid-binding protein
MPDLRGYPVLVDSSALFALADQSDRHHQDAAAVFEHLSDTAAALFTTNFILAETHALILSRSRRIDRAAEFVVSIYTSEQITRIRVEDDDERRALEIITRYQDKAFSFTDATSFAVMERLGIQHAFTFDADFQQYGWVVLQPPTCSEGVGE